MLSSTIRSALVSRTIIYLLLAGFTNTITSLAVPVSYSSWSLAPDYQRNLLWNRSSRHSLDNSLVARVPQILTASDLGQHTASQKRFEDTYSNMLDCYQGAVRSSSTIYKLSNDVSGSDEILSDQLVTYKTNLACIRSGFDYLGRSKGLAFYNRDDELETLLKNLVNLNKDTLSYIDVFVTNIPGVGPILGPIVYEIKCVLDDILNAVENIGDLLLNMVHPLLEECIRETAIIVCKLGLELLGLCL